MVDIIQKPFYNYNEAIAKLNEPFISQANVRLIGFSRMFVNRERILICTERDWCIDFHTNRQLYKIGLYEKPIDQLPSSFNMWDHLPYAPPEIYLHTRKAFGLAHGLTIVQNHGDHCDTFVFVTSPGNTGVNNFYLNQKEQFVSFVQNFYQELDKDIQFLYAHRFSLPLEFRPKPDLRLTITPRQKTCVQLLIHGLSAKEIAEKLLLSPRTVETHVDELRKKFNAKNRVELIYRLTNYLP
jgi:DNA-binding CsgD family transcriptional regulator